MEGRLLRERQWRRHGLRPSSIWDGHTTQSKATALTRRMYAYAIISRRFVYSYLLQMAKAGFMYNPMKNGDDLACCPYCEVTLSGWEAEDDPLCVFIYVCILRRLSDPAHPGKSIVIDSTQTSPAFSSRRSRRPPPKAARVPSPRPRWRHRRSRSKPLRGRARADLSERRPLSAPAHPPSPPHLPPPTWNPTSNRR